MFLIRGSRLCCMFLRDILVLRALDCVQILLILFRNMMLDCSTAFNVVLVMVLLLSSLFVLSAINVL